MQVNQTNEEAPEIQKPDEKQDLATSLTDVSLLKPDLQLSSHQLPKKHNSQTQSNPNLHS